MAFTIPNEANAAFADQAEIDSVDFDVLVASHNPTGVLTGCAVTAQGTPDMTVAVASGNILVAGTEVAVTGGNVTITAADVTNPRFDLVVVNNAGTKSATAGTAASNPVFPAIPANSAVLAAVYVPANDTDIDANQIVDKRVFVTSGGGGGDVATDTIWDAKGDLAAGTGADTAAKLTVGANDTILMADSGETAGLKWVASATPSTQALGDAAAQGTGDTFTRGDHKHAMPTAANVVTNITGITNGLPVYGVVASDITHTQNSTTLENVTGLVWTIGASATEIWFFEIFAIFSATSTSVDLKVGWTAPSGATMTWGTNAGTSAGYGGFGGYSTSGTTPLTLLNIASEPSHGTFNGLLGQGWSGMLFGGGTGGAVQFRFAQNTLEASDLIVKKGSVLRATKVAS